MRKSCLVYMTYTCLHNSIYIADVTIKNNCNGLILSVTAPMCVCDKVVFIQLCHGSSPDVLRWDFSLKRHRCFASLVFSHLPSLSSHHRSCEEEKIRSKFDSSKSKQKNFWINFKLTTSDILESIISLTSFWRVSWTSSWSLLCPASDSSRWRACCYSPLHRSSTLPRPPMIGTRSPGGVEHNILPFGFIIGYDRCFKSITGEKGLSVSNPQSLASHCKDQQFWGLSRWTWTI